MSIELLRYGVARCLPRYQEVRRKIAIRSLDVHAHGSSSSPKHAEGWAAVLYQFLADFIHAAADQHPLSASPAAFGTLLP